jgi:hypothetical protein
VGIHSDQALTPEQRRIEARAVHQSFEDQRKALLTPEQRQKADDLRSAVEKRVQHRVKEMMPGIAQHEMRALLHEHVSGKHLD